MHQLIALKIDKREFTDQLLFTHRGFSGPLALNLSLFVNGNTKIKFNFLPEINVLELLQKEKNNKHIYLFNGQTWKHCFKHYVSFKSPVMAEQHVTCCSWKHKQNKEDLNFMMGYYLLSYLGILNVPTLRFLTWFLLNIISD